MQLTQEQINQAVSDAMPDILAGLRKEIAEAAVSQARQSAQFAVQKAVNDWITTNLIPEILTTLSDNKAGLIAMCPKLAEGITMVMTEAFVAEVKKKLESSWERKKIFEALLG
jgi:hypothetical protein